MTNRLSSLCGQEWNGEGELWTDPAGNTAIHYQCALTVEESRVLYSWVHEGQVIRGAMSLDADGASWSDEWHQQETVRCNYVAEAWGIFAVQYEYGSPEGQRWRWRIALSERPDSSLVLQMTNIAPWGEEGRAVRMVFNQTNT